MGRQLHYTVFQTSMGWVGVLASERGLRRLTLPRETPQQALEELSPEVAGARHAPQQFGGLCQQLEAYLQGERHDLDVLLDMEGRSPFFLRAWQACAAIPPGETRSYAWLAAQAGSPRAMRAAGQAMARNPLPLAIPCHRVVGSDGGLHGYGGGLPMKAHLLELEQQAATKR
ncbi:MAG: methylated-DNA--[protein]-cysteine S-methyltransferase [Chloroflexi bacterium]|nr:methylated-DNA--[protein]-cysteine S-methyltransferase [Chloroflexota bacterium]